MTLWQRISTVVQMCLHLPTLMEQVRGAVEKLSANDAILQDMLRYESLASSLRAEVQVALTRTTDKYNACLPSIPRGDFDELIEEIGRTRGAPLTVSERDSILGVWAAAKEQATKLSMRVAANREEG